ncbi:Glutamate racemase 2 [bioreactor metagenome]|uniref:Glutamate racemase 2 n=1 Tax=bioreactor metagenome TaxID=1076179 RepID=A0A645HQM2_9ZZZZ
MDRGAKVIVVACNTATGAAIRDIREHFSLPVISVEPAIKPACEHEGDGKVLMMATPVTISLDRYQALQQRMPDPDRVINVACPGLADQVEKFVGEADKFEALLETYLGRYRGMKVDGIVLGCTHYIFIKDVIADYTKRNFKGECTLYDGNEGTVKQLGRVLKEKRLLNPNGSGQVEFYTSGEREKIVPLFEKLIKT